MAPLSSGRNARLGATLPWLIAIAGFAFDIAAFWPGQMSFDSAYAWWQARGGDTTDIAPPMFIFVWRIADAMHEGPGLMFALHLVLFWNGLALLAGALRLSAWRAAALMLIGAFAPVPWLLRGHVWTDVALFSALLFATGALARAQVVRRRRWVLAAVPALIYAAAVRHNAMPAVLPFAAWLGWLATSQAATRVRVAIAALALVAIAGAATALVNSLVDRRVPLWPATAEWDLAAISIDTGEMLLPAFMIGPGLDVPELADAYRDWNITPMLQNTRHGMRDPFMEPFTAVQLSELRSAWLGAIRAHPRAWLSHHWQRVVALLGVHDPTWPRELIYVDAEVSYRDNPPVARNASPLHDLLMRTAARLATTSWLAGWPYLLVGVVTAPWAWQRRRELAGIVALVLLTSALLYLGPLLVLAPAELRYLGWSCLASVVAAAVVLLVPRSFRSRPARLSSSTDRTFR
jgi:hypothetical protein